MEITCHKTGKILDTINVKMMNSRRYGVTLNERDYDIKLQELCKKGIASVWNLHDERLPLGKSSVILDPKIADDLLNKLRKSKQSIADFYFEKINPMGALYLK